MPPREFYFNADFDPSLHGRPTLLETGDETYLHEMAWHFAFACAEGDSLIVHKPWPGDFPEYLVGKGLHLPRTVVAPDFTPSAAFHPFGWNAHAESLAVRYSEARSRPALAAVKRVNSRAFALELEREAAGSEDEVGALFADPQSLAAFVAGHKRAPGWVAKGEHGHAGIANRRVPSGALSAEDRTALMALFADHGRVVLEPWHERLHNMAALFTSTPAGAVEGFAGHALINSRDGAFLGVQVAPNRQPPDPWLPALRAHAGRLAERLAAAGYWGPVGVDAYVWQSPAGPRLRPLVDINARLSMAMPAHGLAARLPGRHVHWSWSKPRKLRLPSDYAALDTALGSDAYEPRARRGILAVSPVFLPEGRPKRIGFAMVGEDAADLAGLRETFANALGRN